MQPLPEGSQAAPMRQEAVFDDKGYVVREDMVEGLDSLPSLLDDDEDDDVREVPPPTTTIPKRKRGYSASGSGTSLPQPDSTQGEPKPNTPFNKPRMQAHVPSLTVSGLHQSTRHVKMPERGLKKVKTVDRYIIAYAFWYLC